MVSRRVAWLVLLAAGLLGAAAAPAESARPPAAVGTSMPALCFADAAGGERCLSDWRGQAVLLSLWATWCAPCKAELPELDRLQAQLGGQGLAVVALSLDRHGAPRVRAFLQRERLGHLQVFVDPEMNALAAAGVRAIPAALLVDAGGVVVHRFAGPVDWSAPDVRSILSRALALPPSR
ncbi:TlpA disulfide reductase family protein [Pseudorhodoferax sp. Leaf274]|uniref:TlpA family protein disulfide reductase n=1 Tax=Pseudorhodoferax sp. Leaf274 TaxID=1736318 RepID=UPI000702E6F4|nr:TlpA disulfide reductase family protein [Pseudorhodoferax sp. Leaf274]KQP37327.1 hypothetical protein ASF44_13240 [Pseudorhodoferax sp. Leaf274]